MMCAKLGFFQDEKELAKGRSVLYPSTIVIPQCALRRDREGGEREIEKIGQSMELGKAGV
jgi:hypothetical protein